MSLQVYNDSINQNQTFEVKSWQAYTPRLPAKILSVEVFNKLNKERTLKTFENVCGCNNIEKQKNKEFDTLNDNGNCLKLYHYRFCFDGRGYETTREIFPKLHHIRYCIPSNPLSCRTVQSFETCEPLDHCSM